MLFVDFFINRVCSCDFMLNPAKKFVYNFLGIDFFNYYFLCLSYA